MKRGGRRHTGTPYQSLCSPADTCILNVLRTCIHLRTFPADAKNRTAKRAAGESELNKQTFITPLPITRGYLEEYSLEELSMGPVLATPFTSTIPPGVGMDTPSPAKIGYSSGVVRWVDQTEFPTIMGGCETGIIELDYQGRRDARWVEVASRSRSKSYWCRRGENHHRARGGGHERHCNGLRRWMLELDTLVVVEKLHSRLKYFVERTFLYHDSVRSEREGLP